MAALSSEIIIKSENIDVEYQHIEEWAKEIIAHCRIAKDFDVE